VDVPQRNHALDLLRGLTIALMIVVNNPGDWKQMFSLLKHAEWDGFLGADIVFPLFLFVSGFAAALKIAKMQPVGPHCATALTLDEPEPKPYYLPLVRRAVILFAIGLFLNAWPFGLLPGSEFSISHLRIWGVLQRIAVCALIGGLILYKVKSARGVILTVIVLGLVYELGMRLPLVQISDGTFGRSFALADNFSRYVDILLLPATMLYKVQKIPFDPEGFFTSLTAATTFLLGGLTYRLKDRRAILTIALALLGAGMLLVEPINKNLWTLPYVLLTAAAAVAILSLLEKTGESESGVARGMLAPFVAMGKNPLLIYVLSGIVGKTLALWKLASAVSLKQILFNGLLVLPLQPKILSLLYSLILLSVVMFIAHRLRKLPFRV
jgi:predicted acyltransferase